MSNLFLNFLKYIKTTSNFSLIEAIEKGYTTIFEGSNDMKFVFNAEDWIDRIIHKIQTNQPRFGSLVTLHDVGFEFIYANAFKGSDLRIKFVKSNNSNSNMYDPDRNTIWITFTSKYDKSKESLINIVEETKDAIIHELRHWYDHISYNIEQNKYTKLSQLEKKSLTELCNSAYSFSNDKYINLSSEVNAHICEFIHFILTNVMEHNKKYNYESMKQIFNNSIDTTGMTKDTTSRINKRLYIFSKGLEYLYTIQNNTNLNLKKELINYIDKYTGIVESIDYGHDDIKSKKALVVFEANYATDSDYKMWFNKKYTKNNKCLSSFHTISYNQLNNI